MQAINCSYIYDLGLNISTLSDLRAGSVGVRQLLPAARALKDLVEQDVFHLPLSKIKARAFLDALVDLPTDATNEDACVLSPDALQQVEQLRFAFETVLRAEWSSLAVFAVSPKRAYDMNKLVWQGEEIFEKDLLLKVPEAVLDMQSACRCIAFELPTAAAFHIFRGNEAVMIRYCENLTGEKILKNSSRTMGGTLAIIEKQPNFDPKLVAALKDLKNLHRNPSIHPDDPVGTVDDAIALLSAVQPVITHMLKAIPVSLIK
jgi:hypothetical protein